jgi:hypothetical protein
MTHLDKLLEALFEQDASHDFDIDRIVNEPKRDKIPLTKLNLFKNEGFHNILSVLKKATKEEIDYWGNWYGHATQHVDNLAALYDVPKPIAAAVVAVLSPNMTWKLNLLAAKRVMDNWKHAGGDESYPHWDKIPAYNTNVRKATEILETGDLGLVSGPKVTVFYESLLDPAKIAHDLVLDGHAINIWRGDKRALHNMSQPTKAERVAMIHDYKKVADLVGLSPQAVQAITWVIWRYTHDDLPKKVEGHVNVKQPAPKNKLKTKGPLKKPAKSVTEEGVFENIEKLNEMMLTESVRKIYEKILQA